MNEKIRYCKFTISDLEMLHNLLLEREMKIYDDICDGGSPREAYYRTRQLRLYILDQYLNGGM